ncbi:hypothetical protein DPMN_088222 [Dreissena polymorpha]|uniref:Uncharacterized protein n=1 Tax=Dreissena polymorpha TaxID=45954 RepID=A0A9D4QX41_DREPO|nr:hypothetical protein DPMN_088222 [Dreissena polymorpha]
MFRPRLIPRPWRPYIIKTNVLTKFRENGTFNDKSPAPSGLIFKQTATILELVQYILGKNLPTKMHDDRTMNVASRLINGDIVGTNLLTKFFFNEDRTIFKTNTPRPHYGGHVFQETGTIFELCHDDRTINLASRVLKRFNYSHIKNAPTPGGHVLQQTITTFELVQDIITTHVLSKFHEDWIMNVTLRMKNAPPPGCYGFQPSGIILKFIGNRCGQKVLKIDNAPPPGGHVFHATGNIFQLVQDIIGKNLLTKFHDDRTRNVASRVLTRKNALLPGGNVFQPIGTIF